MMKLIAAILLIATLASCRDSSEVSILGPSPVLKHGGGCYVEPLPKCERSFVSVQVYVRAYNGDISDVGLDLVHIEGLRLVKATFGPGWDLSAAHDYTPGVTRIGAIRDPPINVVGGLLLCELTFVSSSPSAFVSGFYTTNFVGDLETCTGRYNTCESVRH